MKLAPQKRLYGDARQKGFFHLLDVETVTKKMTQVPIWVTNKRSTIFVYLARDSSNNTYSLDT